MPMGRASGVITSVLLAITIAAVVRAQNATPAAGIEAPAPGPVTTTPGEPVIVLPAGQEPGGEGPPRSPVLDAPSQGFSNLLGPAVGQLQPRLDYRATWFPEVPVRAQPTNLSEERQ